MMMGNLLFVNSLLSGDFHTFFVKLGLIVLFWLLVIIASIVDLISGINASKRMGILHTNSYGLRKTVLKLSQYFGILIMFLLIDFCLSALTAYVSLFNLPIISILTTISIIIIEALSVIENSRRGKSKEDDKVDDLEQFANITINQLGTDKIKTFYAILKEYIDGKTEEVKVKRSKAQRNKMKNKNGKTSNNIKL